MEIKIPINTLKEKMIKGLLIRGITGDTAEFIVNDFIEAELDGHTSHGLSKYLLIDAALQKKEGCVELVKEVGNYALVDGHKDLGHIAGLYCVDKATGMAREHGNSIVALRNASRYSRVKPFAKRIAEKGFVGIIMNNGGPAAVAPYGGTTPIFGTNPVCFSFPTNEAMPLVFDFSTSKKVWGEIRQSILENRPLPPDCFYDKDGNITVDPLKAEAVMPFGGAKGYALCYALEILTGAFVGCKMGSKVNDEYDLGFLFIALSPDMFANLNTFQTEVGYLTKEVRDSHSIGPDGVHVPGDRSFKQLNNGLASGVVSVDANILDRINKMETSLFGGLESNNRIN